MINEPSDEQNPESFTDKVDLGESSFAVSTLCRLIVTTAWSQDRPVSDFDFGFPDQIKRDNTDNTFFAERYSAPQNSLPQWTEIENSLSSQILSPLRRESSLCNHGKCGLRLMLH